MITRMEKYHLKQKQVKIGTQVPFSKTSMLVAIHVCLFFLVLLMDGLEYRAKISLFAFLSAMVLWIAAKIPAGFTALGLIVFLVLMKAGEPELLYQSLSEEVVWLMIGSFIIGEAVKKSGLATRLTQAIMKRSNKKSHILLGVGSVLFTSAMFIPSTSGRAALSMPIIQQISEKFSDKEKRTLAVLTPVIILMSTSATLIGAGSHLIGIGLLESTVNQSISFIQWLIWGVPFAIIISFLSFLVTKYMFWPKDGEKEIAHTSSAGDATMEKPIQDKERTTLILIAFLILFWMTESLHGYDIAFITMVGAILIMLPKYGVMDWKQGVKSVSWNLIIFVAAATALGKVLVETGVVEWIEQKLLFVLHLYTAAPEWAVVLAILTVTVTSHLYITSHTTRAIVFIPGLLLFSETLGLNSSAVVFLSLIGMNYCVTFPVSSKALLLFYEEGEISYDAEMLLKISAILMPIYILVMMVFYFTYWQWTGLEL